MSIVPGPIAAGAGGSFPLAAVGSAATEFGQTWYANRLGQKNAREQMGFQNEMAERQMRFSADQYAKRYQTQVRDLMAAGLNPMLAYGQSPGSAPQGTAPSGAMPQVHKSDIVRAVNDTRIASASEMQIRSDTLKKQAEARNVDVDTFIKAGMPALLAAQTALATSSASQAAEMVKQIKQTIPKIEEEIKNLKQEREQSKSQVKVNASILELNSYLNGLRMAETVLAGDQAQKTRYETDVLSPKAKAAGMKTAEWGEIGKNVWKIFYPFSH